MLLAISSLTTQCKKEFFYAKKNGVLIDSKMECGWLIELENKTVLNPGTETLKKFKVTLKEGQKIKIAYKESENQMSFCMAGKLIEIKYIADR